MTQGRLQATVAQYRQALKQREATAELALEQAYAHILAQIQPHLDRLYLLIANARANGEEVTPALLYEANRLETLKLFITHTLDHFGALSHMTVGQLQHEAVTLGQEAAQALMQATVPKGVSYAFGVPDPSAIASIIGATQAGSPLADLFNGFGQEAAKLTSDALVRGLTLGNNPRQIARDVEQALGVSRNRALVISRDQANRAYRSASLENYRANEASLSGYRRQADLSARTCAACLALDGKEYVLDEDPELHTCDRCVMVPITRSWEDILSGLGINTDDIPETSASVSERETGTDWFANQDEATQRQVLGSQGYELYTSGDVDLKDFAHTSHDPDWGPQLAVRPVKELAKGK